jgi:hypothetical protein
MRARFAQLFLVFTASGSSNGQRAIRAVSARQYSGERVRGRPPPILTSTETRGRSSRESFGQAAERPATPLQGDFPTPHNLQACSACLNEPQAHERRHKTLCQ